MNIMSYFWRNDDHKNDSPPDKKLTAVCGLFCPACTLFIGTAKNEPQRLKAVADVYGTTPDVWECHGCRSEKRSYFCKNECKMVDCAKEKGIDFVWNAKNTPVMNYAHSRKPTPTGLSCGKPRTGSKRLDTPNGIRKCSSTMPAPSAEPSTPPMTSSAGRVGLNPAVPMLTGIKVKFSHIYRKRSKDFGKTSSFPKSNPVFSHFHHGARRHPDQW